MDLPEEIPKLVFASDVFRKSETTEQTQAIATKGKQPQKELSTEEQTPMEMTQSEDVVKAKEATRTDDINLPNHNPNHYSGNTKCTSKVA